MEQVQPELTFGEKAVGTTLVSSDTPQLKAIRRSYAKVIDELNEARKNTLGSEAARYFSKAISFTEDACQNAVKAYTWPY